MDNKDSNQNDLNDHKIRTEIAKMLVDIEKMRLESAKIKVETLIYPFVATASIFAIALSVVKYLS